MGYLSTYSNKLPQKQLGLQLSGVDYTCIYQNIPNLSIGKYYLKFSWIADYYKYRPDYSIIVAKFDNVQLCRLTPNDFSIQNSVY